MKNNDMRGRNPDMSFSSRQLRELDLSDQKQTHDGGLSGPIPTGWSNLPELILLKLSGNKLTGVLQPGIGNLPKLEKLDVSNNQLSGGLPAELGKLSSSCNVLDLSENACSTIPKELGDFRNSPDGVVVKLLGNVDM